MRNLIPDQYHIYVVTGAAILCTIVTIITFLIVSIRNAKRLRNAKTNPDWSERFAENYKTALLFNAGFLLIVHIALFLLLGFIDTLIAFGSCVAFIGLVGIYCDRKLRNKQRNNLYR